MVLGRSPKQYKHLMRNMLSALVLHERIQTTHAKAKVLSRAANKLIHFAKKAQNGFTSPKNLIQGRVRTDQVLKKLLLQIVPKVESIKQNYITISKRIRHRRGDNAPMVIVSIRNSEKDEAAKMQAKQARQKSKKVDTNSFYRRVYGQEKAFYEEMIKKNPEKAEFFNKKIALVEFNLWTIDKGFYEKRINFAI